MKNSHLLAGLACMFFLIGSAVAQQDAEQEFDAQVQLDSFDKVWQTIKDKHWDPEIGGIDWEGARDELRPKVEAAKSSKEVSSVMAELLSKLGQSHFEIIPAGSYEALADLEQSGGQGTAGFWVRLIDNQLVVAKVHPTGAAAKAGVETGWIVKQMKDKTAEEFIEKVKLAVSHTPMRLETMIGLAGSPDGEAGKEVSFTFLNAKDEEVTLNIKLEKPPGNRAQFGNLPAFIVEYRSEVLDDSYEYLSFNAFMDGPFVMKKFRESVESARDQDGLIIDLRGNMGGLVIMTMGMSGWLVDEKANLGEMKFRSTAMNLAINPRSNNYKKPVAVLIDECSISAAEILSGGLKDIGAARVFGHVNSAGLVLPSTVEKLPNGDGFQYAFANYTSASGVVLEGTGVIPDQKVELTRESLLGNRDPVLEAAKQWISEQTKK